ncbi:hypothetical protein [Autumnicola musiva]|uniref:DUF998 domain-containing protein n=1 Tax=Autumnicola musiva TaxID=3075589 RepID=A0ABU3DAY6_9FLAO|nr:hypothetical protein [Zunongwangia sp. F117]MDT0678515.1 hypothetical protein [Zunongwangia sp. F117]
MKKTKMPAFLKAEFTKENEIWLTNSKTLRKTIGILGMALPFILIFSLFIFSGFAGPLNSISHYYYTRVSGILIGVMSILSIFLIIYKGKEPIDLLVSLIAGITALFVVMFPTGNITEICQDATKSYSVTILSKNELRETFHYISAAVFLGSLSFMSICLFTKSNQTKDERGTKKILRNRIYRVCGVIMIVSMAVIFLGDFCGMIPEDFYQEHQLTFWMEALAVECFGFSWLVKGETIFKDKSYECEKNSK